MAKQKEKEEVAEVAEEQPKAKSKKKLIIILAAALILVLAAGAAAVLLLSGPADKHGKPAAAEEDKGPPIYESLDTFTVNLAGGDSYLQVEIKLMMGSPDVDAKLKEHMPEVRNDILTLLSSKTPDELSTAEGKDKLAADIQNDINALLKVNANKGVKKVLYGAFLIQ